MIDASKLKTGPSSFKDEDLDRKLRKEALERLQAMTLDFEGIVFPGLGIEPWQWTGDQVQAECPDPGAVHERGGAWGFHTGKMLHSCFGCGYSGDIIGLAQDLLGMEDWKEAYLWLAEGGGRRPDETREAYIDRLVQSATDRTEEEPEPMPDYPPEMLAQYGEIHESVFERGISQGVADRMQLGFDRSHMATTLPHFFDGKLVGIQYRHLAQNAAGHYLCPRSECVKGGKVPKFKNTRPFPRNTTLYNYDVASAYDSVVVVESPMSVLYLMSHWTDRVVATFGGHVSARQARLLYGFGDGVYLWPDNDPTGSDVFMESVGLLAPTVPVYLVPLVAGEKADPGDCPPDQIQDYLDAAIPSWALTTLDGYPVGP